MSRGIQDIVSWREWLDKISIDYAKDLEAMAARLGWTPAWVVRPHNRIGVHAELQTMEIGRHVVYSTGVTLVETDADMMVLKMAWS